jgi:hypothetical protein
MRQRAASAPRETLCPFNEESSYVKKDYLLWALTRTSGKQQIDKKSASRKTIKEAAASFFLLHQDKERICKSSNLRSQELSL